MASEGLEVRPTGQAGGWVVRWSPTATPAPVWSELPVDARRLSSASGPDGVQVLLDGYLFESLRTPTFAQHVWDVYQREGPACITRLRGGFALVLWEPQRQRLSFARDATGLRACYYVWKDGTLLLSSSVNVLLAQPEVRGDWHRTLLVEHLLQRYTPAQQSETHYQEIHRLPPGHLLSLDSGGLTVKRYWDPLPHGFTWATRAESESLPAYLERAVQRCLSVGADCISLSGGFDSVSLAALAAAHTSKSSRLQAISLHINSPECDEKSTQAAVAKALHMPQVIRNIQEATKSNYIEAALALSATSPGPVLSPWQGMYSALYQMAREVGLRDVMMGTGGDEIFSVDPVYSLDLLLSGRFLALWHFLRMWQRSSPFSPRVVARAVLWEHAMRPALGAWKRRCFTQASAFLRTHQRRNSASPSPDWLATLPSSMHEKLAVRLATKMAPAEKVREDVLSAYTQTIRGLPQAPQLLFELEQGMAWAQSHGFTILYPFFDQDLFALALRTRPAHLIRGGWSKAPLRELVAARLPSLSLPKKKVDFTMMLHRVFRQQGAATCRNMGRFHALESLGLIRNGPLQKHLQAYFSGRTNNWRLAWSAMSAESWLRAHKPEVQSRNQ